MKAPILLTHFAIGIVGTVMLLAPCASEDWMVRLSGISMILVAVMVITDDLIKRVVVCLVSACIPGAAFVVREVSFGNYFFGVLIAGGLLIIAAFFIKALQTLGNTSRKT